MHAHRERERVIETLECIVWKLEKSNARQKIYINNLMFRT